MASGYVYPIFSGSYGVTFGAAVAGKAQFAGGNFALVLTENGGDAAPYRFTTWGMAAQAAMSYQSRSAGNVDYVGSNGYVYRVDPAAYTDDGAAIPIIYSTGLLPWVDQQLLPRDIPAEKILTLLSWTVEDVPGSVSVTVAVTDADDDTNVVKRVITQTTPQVIVPIGLRARRWIVSINANVTSNYNIVEFSETVLVKDKARVGSS